MVKIVDDKGKIVAERDTCEGWCLAHAGVGAWRTATHQTPRSSSVKNKNSYQQIFPPYFRAIKKCDDIWPNDRAWPTTSHVQESCSDRNSMKVRVNIIGHYP